MSARPVPVGTGVEVDERDFVQRRCTPSGVANWSWSIKAVELGTHQLRLELQPAVTFGDPAGGPATVLGLGLGLGRFSGELGETLRTARGSWRTPKR